jgi:DNA-binding Xre family transcriptional regulator
MNIRLILRETMQKRGITQHQLSEMTGIPQSGISSLLSSKRIDLPKLSKICKAIGIENIEEIFEINSK